MRLWKKFLLNGVFGVVALVAIGNFWIIACTHEGIYSDLHQIDGKKYGLVLGTNPTQLNGSANKFFDERVQTAFALYQQGKVQYLVLSGTRDRLYYNEPAAMRTALLRLGVPQEALLLDTEGVNTLASIRRAKGTLGLSELIVITQRFHAYRALYISHHYDVSAVALAADGATSSSFVRTLLREVLARVKALLDLHVLAQRGLRTEHKYDPKA